MDKNSTLTERTGSLLATRIVVRDKDGYGDTLPKFGTLRRLTLINYTIVYLVQLGRDREVKLRLKIHHVQASLFMCWPWL